MEITYNGMSLRAYRLRKFKRSVLGQIARGLFACLYYPAISVYEVSRLSLKGAGHIIVFLSVAVWWALGFRDRIAPQIAMTVGAFPVAALTVVTG